MRLRRRYPHTRDRVWRALTEPAALADWLEAVPRRLGAEGDVVTYEWREGPFPFTAAFSLAPAGASTVVTLEVTEPRVVTDAAGHVWIAERS